MKRSLSFWPPYFFTGTKIVSIADNWQEVVIRVKKSWLNNNYVGTIFGGTLYAACDPHFMLMLIQILGIKNYIIWDMAATIRFLKPVKNDIVFIFRITNEELDAIKNQLQTNSKITPEFKAYGVDSEGLTCVEVLKTVYVRNKNNDDALKQ